MMALIPATKRKRARSRLNNRHLPSELLEEILLNLPQKSLVRFSAVSKSWNSLIFDPVFTRKHKNRAALLRRHRLVVYTNANAYGVALMSSDLGSMVTRKRHRSRFVPGFSDTNIDARDFVGQFEGKPHLLAFCDELLCVRVDTSIFLWNPSMRDVVRVPLPSSDTRPCDFIYGLAYDSVNDDYKILRIGRFLPSTTELYSVKNNYWRNIEPFSSPDFAQSSSEQRCEFVGGRFHWIERTATGAPIIASFDLSTDKYGEVAQPQYDEYDDDDEEDFNELEMDGDSDEDFNEFDDNDDDDEDHGDEEDFNELEMHDYDEEDFNVYDVYDDDDDEVDFDELEIITMNGKLCAYYSYTNEDTNIEESRFVLWVMEEYGIEKSWTKRFDIMLPRLAMLGDRSSIPKNLTPLHFSDNYDLLVMQGYYAWGTYILMYINEEVARPRWKIVKRQIDIREADTFFYVESLISVRIPANTHIRFVE